MTDLASPLPPRSSLLPDVPGGSAPGRLGGGLTALASLVGLAAFLYPFLVPAAQSLGTGQARAGEAPLVFAAVAGLCVLAVVADLDPMRAGANAAKLVAMLAALVAVDAALRLVPSFLGASPVFLLMILGGYVYGPRFGFQLGALTMAVSAVVTGGIGPWLPYQMLGAGWVGLTAGWLPHPRPEATPAAGTDPTGGPIPAGGAGPSGGAGPRGRRRELTLLAVFGAVWGLLFGALLNLWFWPVAAPGGEVAAGLAWSPDLSVTEALRRYAAFYAATSLWYDAARAAGNVALVLALGAPLLRTLERHRARLTWTWRPA